MSKYTWDDMELCKKCHYKNSNPDLCNHGKEPVEKPGTMQNNYDCGRYLAESKWKRMPESTDE